MAAAPALSLTLYQHVHDLVELLEESELAAPEVRGEYDGAIREFVYGTKEKIDRVNAALSQLENVAAHATDEIERLQSRKTSALRNVDRLKLYVIEVMQMGGVKKLEGHTSGFTLRVNAPSVEIVDEAALPAEFIQVRETRSPMKECIKGAIGRGVDVPGARVIRKLSLMRR